MAIGYWLRWLAGCSARLNERPSFLKGLVSLVLVLVLLVLLENIMRYENIQDTTRNKKSIGGIKLLPTLL
jgi:hypothetical protein